MAVVKVIEVLAQSEKSFEDALQVALREASRSIRNIKSIYVKDMQAIVDGDRIAEYRVNTKISFAIEDELRADGGTSSGRMEGKGNPSEPEG